MPTQADITFYYCTRCEAFGRELVVKKHEISDAEHLGLKKVDYVKRSVPGVVFYPITCFFSIDAYPHNKDEKWLEKPVYEIFIKELDGGRRVLGTVSGSLKAHKTLQNYKHELTEKETFLFKT